MIYVRVLVLFCKFGPIVSRTAAVVQARSAPKFTYARIIILLTVICNTHILIYMHAASQIPHESN